MKDLKGKVAVVTGGASGIGFATAERLLDAGMKVVIADIEEAALNTAAGQLTGQVLAVRTDVADPASVDRLAEKTIEAFGAAHVLFNNAGVNAYGFTTWEAPAKTWEWVLGVNLWGVINGIRTFVPLMLKAGEGHVVSTASLAGLGVVQPMLAPYSASKHAVIAISESLHHELAGTGVGVSVVCPGIVQTNIGKPARHWPGDEGQSATFGPRGVEVRQFLDTHAVDGAPAASVAELVETAITTERFLCTSADAAARDRVQARLREIDGAPPSFAAGSKLAELMAKR